MPRPTAKRTAIRQVIANLLRLAHADARDARILAAAGGTRNAANLLHSGISRVIEAVVASEQGYTGPAETDRIDAQNPLKESLLRLGSLPRPPLALQQDWRLAEPPSAASVTRPLDELAATLDRLARHFGVDLEDSAPARSAEPLRLPAQAPPPPPPRLPQEERPSRPARHKGTGSPASRGETEPKVTAKVPKPAAPASPPPLELDEPEGIKPAARNHATLSSAVFWSLVDRWKLSDLDALQMIGHEGGLTKKGTRPRFKLSSSESEIVSAMRSLDATLEQLRLDPAQWLLAPLRPDPFRSASPLEVIRRGRLQAFRDLGRYLTQMSLRLSLKQT